MRIERRRRSIERRTRTPARAPQWRWRLDEVYVKINGQMHYLWRAVDHEGEALGSFATRTRDKAAALRMMKRLMRCG
jgi:putative transposase